MQLLPRLGLYIEQIDLSIPIGVFAPNQYNFSGGYRQSTASPQWILHAHCQYRPDIPIYLIHLNRVIDFLFCAPEETSEGVDKLVIDGAG